MTKSPTRPAFSQQEGAESLSLLLICGRVDHIIPPTGLLTESVKYKGAEHFFPQLTCDHTENSTVALWFIYRTRKV